MNTVTMSKRKYKEPKSTKGSRTKMKVNTRRNQQ